MKNIFILSLTVLLFSCNQSDSKKETETNKIDSSKKDQQIDNGKKGIDTVVTKKNDTASLMKMADEIMMAAKTKDYVKFAAFIHPDMGVRFYPFSGIDTSNGVKVNVYNGNQLVELAKQKKRIDWGSGYSEPEKLTVDQYFAQCVYNVDYLKSGLKFLNKINRGGTAEMIDVKQVFAGHNIVEYFFPGTEKNGQMDWSAVRLVFEMKDNVPYLYALVFDHWTP